MRGQREMKKILCTREFQNSIDESVMAVLQSQASKLGLENFYEFQKTAIYGKNGTKFIFKGLRQNINSIKSFEDVDIVWNEEAQTTSQKSIDVLYPTIRKPGSQIITSYNTTYPTDPIYIETVTKHNPEDAYLCHVTYLDNPHIDEEFVRRAERIKQDDIESYNHIYLGEFDTRFSGAVYAKWMATLHTQGRISTQVKHDPDYPVYTAWDLGYDDATSIIFYQLGSNEVFIIDYYESNMEDILHYCEVLYGRKIIVEERQLETGDVLRYSLGEEIPEHVHRKDYRYHAHYGPHDASYKIQAAGGRSIISQADKLGVKMFSIPATSMQNNIEAFRETLPKCWVNADRCKDLVSALMHYHFDYDEDKKMFSKEPVHDWSSHAADAGELMARVWRESATTTKELDRRQLVNSFHSKRRDNNLVQEDPYRLRKKR